MKSFKNSDTALIGCGYWGTNIAKSLIAIKRTIYVYDQNQNNCKILKKRFPNLKVKYKNRDKLTPIRGTLSNNKIKNLLKHKSKFPIENGYNKYIDWYVDFYNKNFN